MTRSQAPTTQPPIGNTPTSSAQRVLLAKIGLDGHDRGIKIVARGLRDQGFHVIYGGIWQSPEAVAQAALDEDADWLGLSLLNGAHMTLVPRVMHALQQSGNTHTRCLLGGIIPEDDVTDLHDLGVSAVFGPGTAISSIADYLHQARSHSATEAPRMDVAALVAAIGRGDRTALARLLTLIANGYVDDTDLSGLRDNPPSTNRTLAITGSAGVGKSSLIGDLAARLVQHGNRVAVLACDPQSPITGGALLGDRVRMSAGFDDPRLLVRSLAVASGRQGIAEHLDLMIRALQSFGFQLVMIESVGVGQGDVAVREYVQRVILLLQPETGDGVQWEKAGLLEIADLIVINKSDLPGADRLESELNHHLKLPGYRNVPILRTSAIQGNGLQELCQYLMP